MTDEHSRFFEQLVEDGDKPISPDTKMFEVYALDKPNGTNKIWSTPEDEILIGHIYSRSFFTQSLWGDERLLFQHSSLSKDLLNIESPA